ncbi:MAG: sulfite exporter TauE/SafE family protein [Bacteroidia bacterium]
MIYLPAIILGSLGSFHCAGMCGPIALNLPYKDDKNSNPHLGIILYNFGRITTYGILGLLFGLVGNTFVFFGVQQILSIIIGALILVSLVFTSHLFSKNKIGLFIDKKLFFVKTKIGMYLDRKGLVSHYTIGALNGMLPCGLVYMALAGALSTYHPINAATFMLIFGASTIPMLYTIALFGKLMRFSFRNHIKAITPYVVGIMAILLILRGLNLGIPYISPKINNAETLPVTQNLIKCHK